MGSSEFRQRVERECRVMYEKMMDEKSVQLAESGKHLLEEACVGGVTFYAVVSSMQLLQWLSRVSVAVSPISSFIGATAVITGSVGALQFANVPRSFLSSNQPLQTLWQQKIDNLTSNKEHLVSQALGGIVVFSLLGGRFRNLAPSDYRFLGAFHNPKASLPATLEYASASNRLAINQFGKLFGCHTCGVKKAKAVFHADHMPPVKYALIRNKNMFRRLLGIKIEQRYYPQCSSCSNVQGIQVKADSKKLKLHLLSFRGYHLTGFWLVVLCSALISHSTGELESKTKKSFISAFANKTSDVVMEPSLQYLRLKEKSLRSRLNETTDQEERILIRKKLQGIEKRKSDIKLDRKK